MRLLGLSLWLLLSTSAFAQSKLFDEPLKPLAITLTANFKLVNTPNQTGAEIGRHDLGRGMVEPKYFRSSGTLSYTNEAGRLVTLDADVEPRGMRRRQSCEYKPLDIKLKDRPTDELFKNSAKGHELVTHCRGNDFEADLYTEYFSYRTKTAFAAPGFRVRLAEFTYVDTAGAFPTVTHSGIFLEPKKDMAKRLNAEVIRLTKEEEEVPLTPEELAQASWAIRYGDSFISKIALRSRVYNKYVAIREAAKPGLRDIFLQRLGLSLILNYDTGQQWLINTFPIQFANGAAQMVEYDFDTAQLGDGFKKQVLFGVFNEFASGMNMSLDQYKMQRPREMIEADKEVVLAAIREAIAAYQASGLEEELRGFKKHTYNADRLLNFLSESLRELNSALDNPNEAFSFLR